MIKSNIKIAIFAILGMIVFWLVMFFFIKVDVSSQAVVTFVDDTSYIAIEKETASYIENHEITYLKMQYNKQYFNCHITYSSGTEEYKYYFIYLPEVVTTTNAFTTNIVVDSLNLYQYWLKK